MVKSVDLAEWDKKRTRTYYVYLVQALFNGLELTIVQGTLWSYLTTLIDVDNPKLFYNIINGIIFFAPIVFGSLVGRWVDKTRNLKFSLVILNTFILVGTLLYMLPFSPMFPTAGRMLHGCNFIIRSLMYSELSRSYPSDEVQQKIPAFLIGISLGQTIGPFVNMIFLKIDFWVGKLHFMYGNSPSLSLVLFSTIQIFLITFCSHDLSKEYDLKLHETQPEYTEKPSAVENRRYWNLSLKCFPRIEVIVMMIMSFHSGFGIVFFPRIIPLIVEGLGYNPNEVNWVFFGFGISGVFFTLAITKMKLTSVELFYSGFASLVAFTFMNVGILFMSKDLNSNLNTVLLVICTLSWSFFMATTKTFLIVTFNKFFYSSNQTFGESIRTNITLLGRLMAAFIVTYIYEYFMLFSIVNMATTLFILVSIVIKKESLSMPVASM